MIPEAPIDLTTDSGIAEDVALFIFNRPDLTRQIVAEVARYRPARLLVVADGPRDAQEERVCAKTRAVIDEIDWDCEVLRNFSESNLGCRQRVSSGLEWVFEQCERAIILEDDCLPDPSFFRFCSALLEHYKDDPRVMHIGGSSFSEAQEEDDATYFFSRHTDIWGWATWRRAFAHYDVGMKDWPALRHNLQNGAFGTELDEVNFWTYMFDQTHSGAMNTWDFQWHFTVFKNHGLACVPKVNLISNLGCGTDATATHTVHDDNAVANLPTFPIEEIRHPSSLSPDERNATPFFYARYFYGCFFEDLGRVFADERRIRRRKEQLATLDGTAERPTAAVVGLTRGAVLPEAFDAIHTRRGSWARLLRRLCRLKLIQSANLGLHRASLVGHSVISEMEPALLAEHFAIPVLLGDTDTPIVFDVGSYHGEFATKMRRGWPAARVLAFDPNQEPSAEMEEAGVEFKHLALGAIPGPITLYRNKKDTRDPNASFSREVTALMGSGETDEEPVECMTVDLFLNIHELDRVDLMKVTVSGMEWEVLFGADSSLRDGALPALILKFGPEQALAATPMIYFYDQLRGYLLYRMTPNKLARMYRYDFITGEVYADQYILAVSEAHPNKDAIWQISRR